ncbi:hypothetical protein LCGC14_1716610 [marine sediment metagenome]|uniref:Uncharacterized protein n=1 Tax=marine sediment metagenome TaxID=412755 RepID=A0A0F9KDJ7_9ZZZZ
MHGLAILFAAALIYFVGWSAVQAFYWFGPYHRFYRCQMCSGFSDEPLDFMGKRFCGERCRTLYEVGLYRHWTRYFKDDLPF